MKVWITKYALTKGLIEADAEIVNGSGSGTVTYARTKKGIFTREYARTRAEAVIMAEKMRKARIASLKKSIAKLEKLTWSEKGNA